MRRMYYSIEEQIADCYAFLEIPFTEDDLLAEDKVVSIEEKLNGLFMWVEHPDFIQSIPQFRATGQYPFQKEKVNEIVTEYAKLVLAEQTCHTIEIREKATGKEGVANTCADGVELFYGADDGSDDKVVSAEEFSRDFEITAMIKGRG